MEYLILHEGKAFFTKWFQYENHYVKGMIVFNLVTCEYTTDGIIWKTIEWDHL